MIRSLAKRASRALDAFVGDVGPSEKKDDTEAEAGWDPIGGRPTNHNVERAYVAQFVTEDELSASRRRCEEYFAIIETIEKERNDWIKMWRTQASEHLTAQAMLERDLAATRQTAARAIMMLNKRLVADGNQPIDKPAGLEPYDGEPVGLAESYATRMLALRDELGSPIDAKAARDDVDLRAADRARALDSEAVVAAQSE